MTPEEYLQEPYTFIFVPDKEIGGFTGYIKEFSGCIEEGDTLQETYDNLVKIAVLWIDQCLEDGQEVPKPRNLICPEARLPEEAEGLSIPE